MMEDVCLSVCLSIRGLKCSERWKPPSQSWPSVQLLCKTEVLKRFTSWADDDSPALLCLLGLEQNDFWLFFFFLFFKILFVLYLVEFYSVTQSVIHSYRNGEHNGNVVCSRFLHTTRLTSSYREQRQGFLVSFAIDLSITSNQAV